MEYIIENKEWIFSGIGITIISMILFILIRLNGAIYKKLRVKRDNQTEDKTKIENNELLDSRPFPSDIIVDIDNSPPFQQDEKNSYYTGLEVKWSVSIEIIEIKSDTEILLGMFNRGIYPWICCVITVNQYPWIKTINSNEKVWITGIIKSVKNNVITLANPKLYKY